MKSKKVKYNLAGIKVAGEQCANHKTGSYTCSQLEYSGCIIERRLHEDIFVIRGPFTFMSMWRDCELKDRLCVTCDNYLPTGKELKEVRLMSLAMTHEIARRLNKGDNIV